LHLSSESLGKVWFSLFSLYRYDTGASAFATWRDKTKENRRARQLFARALARIPNRLLGGAWGHWREVATATAAYEARKNRILEKCVARMAVNKVGAALRTWYDNYKGARRARALLKRAAASMLRASLARGFRQWLHFVASTAAERNAEKIAAVQSEADTARDLLDDRAAQHDKSMADKDEELAAADKSREVLSAEREEAARSASKLFEELQTLRSEMDTDKETLRSSMEKDKQTLQAQIDKAKAEIDKEKAETGVALSAASVENDKLAAEVTKLAAKLHDVRASLEALSKTSAEVAKNLAEARVKAKKEMESLTKGFSEQKEVWEAMEKHLREEVSAAAVAEEKSRARWGCTS
jgi:uncharacterized phage infection (PIP) family protein YhgE